MLGTLVIPALPSVTDPTHYRLSFSGKIAIPQAMPQPRNAPLQNTSR